MIFVRMIKAVTQLLTAAYQAAKQVMIIDTPGMRARHVGCKHCLGEAFSDVESYFGQCKFSDCRHQTEPGCAIRAAVERRATVIVGSYQGKRQGFPMTKPGIYVKDSNYIRIFQMEQANEEKQRLKMNKLFALQKLAYCSVVVCLFGTKTFLYLAKKI